MPKFEVLIMETLEDIVTCAKTPGHVCAIETNFYTDRGSKLTETANGVLSEIFRP